MMRGMSPGDMMGMTHEMMPKMMENCSQFMTRMHEETPKVMKPYFGKMSAEERMSMLSMCQGRPDDPEKEVKASGSSGPA